MSLCNSDTAAESDLRKKKKKNCGRDARERTRRRSSAPCGGLIKLEKVRWAGGIDCWNLIYHMPPQLRSLFIIKGRARSMGAPQPRLVHAIWWHHLHHRHHRTSFLPRGALKGTGRVCHLSAAPHSTPPPRPPSDPHPPRGLMRRWEHLSRSSLQVLFFCLIGVLLVTINSFLARLQAALIRCHGEKSNVHFHSHQTGSHAGYKGLILVFLSLFFFFEGKKSNSWFLRLLAACCGSKQN